MSRDITLLRRYLELVGIAEAAGEALDVATLAEELSITRERAAELAHRADGFGFVFGSEGDVPVLSHAGRQYLRAEVAFPRPVLTFLSDTIDDLHARHALLRAGSVLVTEFRAALLAGRAVEHARELVPPAFADTVDPRRAVDLFAAATALLARLSSDHPAGCVAEEILAVALIEEARAVLEGDAEAGRLSREDALVAAEELRALFELFQDDDTLTLWEMREPSDAAVAAHAPLHAALGVADQRVEAWFVPFGWTAPTGYLHERPAV